LGGCVSRGWGGRHPISGASQDLGGGERQASPRRFRGAPSERGDFVSSGQSRATVGRPIVGDAPTMSTHAMGRARYSAALGQKHRQFLPRLRRFTAAGAPGTSRISDGLRRSARRPASHRGGVDTRPVVRIGQHHDVRPLGVRAASAQPATVVVASGISDRCFLGMRGAAGRPRTTRTGNGGFLFDASSITAPRSLRPGHAEASRQNRIPAPRLFFFSFFSTPGAFSCHSLLRDGGVASGPVRGRSASPDAVGLGAFIPEKKNRRRIRRSPRAAAEFVYQVSCVETLIQGRRRRADGGEACGSFEPEFTTGWPRSPL